MHKIKLCFNEISLEISNLLICVCNSNKTSKLSNYNLNLLSSKNILYILIRISNKITLIKISTTMELELRKISIVRPYLSWEIITETTSTTIVSWKTHYRLSLSTSFLLLDLPKLLLMFPIPFSSWTRRMLILVWQSMSSFPLLSRIFQ